MNNKIIIYILICLFSCTNNKEDNIPLKASKVYSHNNLDSIQEDLKNAINFGNFNSYNKVANHYILKDNWVDFYYYALLMANKHNCPEAHYHLYYFLTQKIIVNEVSLFSNDEYNKKLSLFHLLRSYELGYDKSKRKVKSIYGNHSLPNSLSVLCN